jgi:ABC-2 type transport system ATP-binding protein
LLIVENLVKKYGKFVAVDELSFQIDEGHIYGFVGANGAGKTTTMKIIAGLLLPNSGKVVLDGVDIKENPTEIKRRLGYMPDFFGVYDDLKVTEYMNFYAGIYGVSSNKRPEIIKNLIELVNLSEKRDAYVDELSRGMKQRLCLARSLIHNPQLLILDEPASGLDPRARVEMKDILRELRKMGKTILISSHILPELAELCTSIGIIERGKMVVSGTVEEIMKKSKLKRIIRVKSLGESDPLIKFLKEQPNLSDIEVNGDVVEADFSGDSECMHKILKELITSGIKIVSFSEAEKNLESVFMQLTVGVDENDKL